MDTSREAKFLSAIRLSILRPGANLGITWECSESEKVATACVLLAGDAARQLMDAFLESLLPADPVTITNRKT